MGKSFMSLVVTTIMSAAAFAPAGAVTVTLVPLSSNSVAPALTNAPCAVPNAPAGISGAPFVEEPRIAEDMGATGTSGVVISLRSSGALASESLMQTSGNTYLDGAALRSARMTSFKAETIDCVPSAGTYLYSVEF